MNWSTVQTRRVFDIVNGGTPTSDETNWGGAVAWATPVDLGAVDGRRIARTDRTLTDRGLATGSRSVPPTSLIVSTRAPIGYVAETETTMAFNQGCRGLVPKMAVDTRFFRYQFSIASDRLQALGQGSTFVELSTDALAAFPVRVPPLGEQRAIADYLDTETARIDALITKKRRLITLLEERRTGSIEEELQFVQDYVSLRWVMSQIADGTHGSYERVDEGVPLLSAKNLKNGVVVQGDNESKISQVDYDSIVRSRKFAAGDVLLGVIGGSIGNAAVLAHDDPRAFQRSVAALSCGHAYDSTFLWFVVASKPFQEQLQLAANSAAQSGVYLGDLADIQVPLPPLMKQLEIVDRLTRVEAHVAVLKSRLDRQLDLLVEHRQALITAAVTGEFQVPGVVV